MEVFFRKISVAFLGVMLIGYGYFKNKERAKLEKECGKAIAETVKYEEDEEGYGRYIYEYEVNGVKYRSGFDRVVQRDKKSKKKVEEKYGDKIMIYYNKNNPKKISKVNDYTVILSFLGGICIIVVALLFA